MKKYMLLMLSLFFIVGCTSKPVETVDTTLCYKSYLDPNRPGESYNHTVYLKSVGNTIIEIRSSSVNHQEINDFAPLFSVDELETVRELNSMDGILIGYTEMGNDVQVVYYEQDYRMVPMNSLDKDLRSFMREHLTGDVTVETILSNFIEAFTRNHFYDEDSVESYCLLQNE